MLFLGGHGGEATPDPIPNSEVKGPSGEGTAAVGRGRVARRQGFSSGPRFRKVPGAVFFRLRRFVRLRPPPRVRESRSPRRGAASASAFPLLPASAPTSFRCGLKPRLIAPPLRRSRFSASLPASPSKFFYPTSTASRPAKPPRDRRAAAFAATSRPRFSALRADLRTVASARLRAVAFAP